VVEQFNKIKILFVCLFVVSVAGLLINSFVEFPWEGLRYTLDIYNVEASRAEETIFGIKRLAGFSRFAFDAAVQIILVSIFLVVHIKNNFIKVIIWCIAGLAIVLTTVKGIILSYLLISMLLLLQVVDNKMMDYYHIYRKIFLMLLTMVFFLPFLSYFAKDIGSIKLIGDSVDMLFTSFAVRLYDTWPEVIDIVQNYGNPILGRGLGGIGQPQVFFENNLYNSCDNLFIYLYAQFGVIGIIYIVYFYLKSRSLSAKNDLYFCLLLFIILQFGITSSIFETPLLCLFVGFLLAHITNPKLRMEYQKRLSM
ncbi:MAG: O-antigen ligase family protein, partial [Bacteroidales bacterium]